MVMAVVGDGPLLISVHGESVVSLLLIEEESSQSWFQNGRFVDVVDSRGCCDSASKQRLAQAAKH
jgi:hypothetical protein